MSTACVLACVLLLLLEGLAVPSSTTGAAHVVLSRQPAVCAEAYPSTFWLQPAHTHRHTNGAPHCPSALNTPACITPPVRRVAQVLDVIETLFLTMFEGLTTRYAAELEAVQAQYPFVPIQAKPVRLTFAGGGGAEAGGSGRWPGLLLNMPSPTRAPGT